jgi:hypothetical protein
VIKLELTEPEFIWILSRLNAETSHGVFEEMYCNSYAGDSLSQCDPFLAAKFAILRPLAAKMKDAANANKISG